MTHYVSQAAGIVGHYPLANVSGQLLLTPEEQMSNMQISNMQLVKTSTQQLMLSFVTITFMTLKSELRETGTHVIGHIKAEVWPLTVIREGTTSR